MYWVWPFSETHQSHKVFYFVLFQNSSVLHALCKGFNQWNKRRGGGKVWGDIEFRLKRKNKSCGFSWGGVQRRLLIESSHWRWPCIYDWGGGSGSWMTTEFMKCDSFWVIGWGPLCQAVIGGWQELVWRFEMVGNVRWSSCLNFHQPSYVALSDLLILFWDIIWDVDVFTATCWV